MKPSAAIAAAIKSFSAGRGVTLKPRQLRETSIIFDYGVRVEIEDGDKTYLAWICLGDEECRRTRSSVYVLSNTTSKAGTSKAAKHLREKHQVMAEKSANELLGKRSREEEIDHLRSSLLFRNNLPRMSLLLEAFRVIMNNLAFRFGEYKESRMIEALLKKPDAVTSLTVYRMWQAMVEIYAAAKKERW